MANQKRRKAGNAAPLASTPAIKATAATLPAAPANDTGWATRAGNDTRPWMRSPMPDGFAAMGTLSGVARKKIDRFRRAANSKNTQRIIAAILGLYEGPGNGFELCAAMMEVGDRMYWTFRADRCADAEPHSDK